MKKRQRKVKHIFLTFLIIILFGVLSGCNFLGLGGQQQKPEGGGGQKQEEKTKIGLSLADMKGDSGKAIKEAFEKEKEKKKLEIMAKDAKMDAMQQTIDVEDLINQKVKVIIIDMIDPTAGEKLVNRIKEKNIKVIALNNLPENAAVDAYITSDNVRAGELQGEYVAQNVDQGKVLILQGDENSTVAKETTSGNLTALQANPKLEVLPVKAHPEWRAEEAEKTVQQALVDSDNKLKAIIANNGELAASATKVLKQMQLSQQVVTVGGDADKKGMEAITKGEHDAEIDRRPDVEGQFAVQAASQLAEQETWTDFDRKIKNGEHDVPVKVVPVRLVDKENVFLLEERLGKPKKEEEQEGQRSGVEKVGEGGQGEEGEGGGQGGSQGQGGGQGQGQSPSKVTIKTQDGQKLEFELSGQMLEIEIEGRLKKVETKEQGGQGGGGDQPGGGQGGGGGGGGTQGGGQ